MNRRTSGPRIVTREVDLQPHQEESLLGYLARLDRFTQRRPATYPGGHPVLVVPVPIRSQAEHLAFIHPGRVHISETSGKRPYLALLGDTVCLAYPARPQDVPALTHGFE